MKWLTICLGLGGAQADGLAVLHAVDLGRGPHPVGRSRSRERLTLTLTLSEDLLSLDMLRSLTLVVLRGLSMGVTLEGKYLVLPLGKTAKLAKVLELISFPL